MGTCFFNSVLRYTAAFSVLTELTQLTVLPELTCASHADTAVKAGVVWGRFFHSQFAQVFFLNRDNI